MNLGDIPTKVQCTARLFITPPGGGAYVNLGNLDGHKITRRRAGNRVTEADFGFHREVRDLTTEISDEYEFTLSEQFGTVNELWLMGTKGADTTQALVAAPTGTFTINNVQQGQTYPLGVYDLNNFVVTGKVVNVDYTIDLGAGLLYIVPGGGIANSSNISGTYGCAAVTFENYTTLDRAGQQSGACVIQELDQHDPNKTPLRETSGGFQYWIEGDEDQTGKKTGQLTLHLIATDTPTVKERKSA